MNTKSLGKLYLPYSSLILKLQYAIVGVISMFIISSTLIIPPVTANDIGINEKFFVATVTTDKLDYMPGETAYASGSGWDPGEEVELNVHEEPFVHPDVVTMTFADVNGNFSNVPIYTFDQSDVGASFTLTATGQTSGFEAFTYFTDAQPAVDLDQGRNGPAGSPITPVQWVNGNLNSSQAHYVEGYTVPYRLIMTDLPTDGTIIELTLAYDAKHSGAHAIDFLTEYECMDDPDHTASFGHGPETVVPLAGVVGVSATTDMTAITTPPTTNTPVPGQPTMGFANNVCAKQITLFGGTFTGVEFAYEDENGLAQSADLSTANAEQKFTVRFTAASATAVLAWGGHIGSRLDWGFDMGVPRSAGGISGSPYHMRVIDWNLNNLGNQDRSLSAGAVAPPPECGLLGPLTVCAGSSNVYTAETNAMGATFSWAITNNSAGASFDGGVDTGSPVNITVTTAGSYMLTLTIDDNGNMSTCEVEVTVNPNPVCSITGPDGPLCPLTLGSVYSAPMDMDVYEWSIAGNGSIIGSSDQQMVTVDVGNTCNDYFTLTLIVTEDGCINQCEKIVMIQAPALICNAPAPITKAACDPTTDFATWLAGFNGSGGGCSAIVTYDVSIDGAQPTTVNDLNGVVPPSSCGGSVAITVNVSDLCQQSTSCSSIYRVPAAPPLFCNAPATIVKFDCPSTADFDAWINFFSGGGGCNATVTYEVNTGVGPPVVLNTLDGIVAPDICGGLVEITVLVTDDCNQTTSCSSRYEILEVLPFPLDCPDDVLLECADMDDLVDAFNAWVSDLQAVTGGICDPTITLVPDPATLPVPLQCDPLGTSYSVTVFMDDICFQDQCTSTFTVIPDIEPPMCPDDWDQNIVFDTSTCLLFEPYLDIIDLLGDAPSLSDNCTDPEDLSFDLLSEVLLPGECAPGQNYFEERQVVRTYEFTDACGNVSEPCVQTITYTITSCKGLTDFGTIGIDGQTEISIPPGCDPPPITPITPVQGECGYVEYMWLYSTQTQPNGQPYVLTENNLGTIWFIIPGAEDPSFDPGPLNVSTYYMRCARNFTCCAFGGESNPVSILIDPQATCPVFPLTNCYELVNLVSPNNDMMNQEDMQFMSNNLINAENIVGENAILELNGHEGTVLKNGMTIYANGQLLIYNSGCPDD